MCLSRLKEDNGSHAKAFPLSLRFEWFWRASWSQILQQKDSGSKISKSSVWLSWEEPYMKSHLVGLSMCRAHNYGTTAAVSCRWKNLRNVFPFLCAEALRSYSVWGERKLCLICFNSNRFEHLSPVKCPSFFEKDNNDLFREERMRSKWAAQEILFGEFSSVSSFFTCLFLVIF